MKIKEKHVIRYIVKFWISHYTNICEKRVTLK